MQIYYPSLEAIHQQTLQLETEPCAHCGRTHQLVSHGFIRKKCRGAEPAAVGKRVWCSNRRRRTGCGRTTQLYLDSTVRYLHHAGSLVVAFVLSLLSGVSIDRAYRGATGASTSRHAYRWLRRLQAQTSAYRSLFHRPPLDAPPTAARPSLCLRRHLLASTFPALIERFGQPLCQHYQLQQQSRFF